MCNVFNVFIHTINCTVRVGHSGCVDMWGMDNYENLLSELSSKPSKYIVVGEYLNVNGIQQQLDENTETGFIRF